MYVLHLRGGGGTSVDALHSEHGRGLALWRWAEMTRARRPEKDTRTYVHTCREYVCYLMYLSMYLSSYSTTWVPGGRPTRAPGFDAGKARFPASSADSRSADSSASGGRRKQNRTKQDKTGQNRTKQDKTGQNRTKQDKTGQNRTKQDKTGRSRTKQDKTGQNRTKQDEAGQNRTKQDKTGQNRTKQDEAGQNRTKQDKTGRSRTKQDKTGQNRTKQDKTGQNRTKQDKTGQNRTKQNKTKRCVRHQGGWAARYMHRYIHRSSGSLVTDRPGWARRRIICTGMYRRRSRGLFSCYISTHIIIHTHMLTYTCACCSRRISLG